MLKGHLPRVMYHRVYSVYEDHAPALAYTKGAAEMVMELGSKKPGTQLHSCCLAGATRWPTIISFKVNLPECN